MPINTEFTGNHFVKLTVMTIIADKTAPVDLHKVVHVSTVLVMLAVLIFTITCCYVQSIDNSQLIAVIGPFIKKIVTKPYRKNKAVGTPIHYQKASSNVKWLSLAFLSRNFGCSCISHMRINCKMGFI